MCQSKNAVTHKTVYKSIISSCIGERLVMDYTFMQQEALGFTYILVIIDHFSKRLWAKPYKSKESANVELLHFVFFSVYPIQNVASDNGREFKNKLVQKEINDNCAIFIYGSTYHPQMQRVMEKAKRTLKDHLTILVDQKKNCGLNFLMRRSTNTIIRCIQHSRFLQWKNGIDSTTLHLIIVTKKNILKVNALRPQHYFNSKTYK